MIAAICRILLLSMLAPFLLLVSGCWDRNEMNDLAIVLAAGIDMDENKKTHLSAQIFVPRQSGGSTAASGGSEGKPSGVTMVVSAQGDNIADAMTMLQRSVSRHVFWGHCEVIVFGKQASKGGLPQYLDFLLRYYQFREHARVFYCDTRAEKMLGLMPPLERSSAEALREMGNMKLGADMTMLDLAKSLTGPAQSVVLTEIATTPPRRACPSNRQ